MSAFIQSWIDAVKAAIDSGMSLEEAQDKISLLDRYPCRRCRVQGEHGAAHERGTPVRGPEKVSCGISHGCTRVRIVQW